MIRCTKVQHKPTDRDGAVLVEFSIVLPVALLLFLGFLEMSRVLLLQHSIDTAAYEGARHAMVPGAKTSEAIEAASELCKKAGLKEYKIEVEPEVLSDLTPFITVRVSLPADKNAVGGNLYFNKKRLVSSVTLMCERPPMVQLTGIPILQEIVDELPEDPPEPEEEPAPTPEPTPEPEPQPVPEDKTESESAPAPAEDPSPADPTPSDPTPPSPPPPPKDPEPQEPAMPVYKY